MIKTIQQLTAERAARPPQIHVDMLPILNEHTSYFMARYADGRAGPVLDLYQEHIGTPKLSWSRSCSPRKISGHLTTIKSKPNYDQTLTPTSVRCSCPAWTYSSDQTCKHIAVLLMLLWERGFILVTSSDIAREKLEWEMAVSHATNVRNRK